MDASPRSTRKFPAMTTDALKVSVMDYQMGVHPCGQPAIGHVEAMVAEVLRREAGVSKHAVTPQVGW